jgi:hypothetical protein
MPFANSTTLQLASLFLSRAWLLLIIAAASRQSGSAILEVIYPDRPLFYTGLAIGLLPLSRLFLVKQWQRLCFNTQRILLLFTALADLTLLVHILAQHHWALSLMQAIPLWCVLMLVWLLLKELLRAKEDKVRLG